MTGRILVGADLTRATASTVRAAQKLGRATGNHLVLVHVVTAERLQELVDEQPDEFGYVDIVLARLEQNLRSYVEESGHDGGTTEAQVVEGRPGGVLLDLAKQDSTFYVVIGVTRRSRVGKLLFGSTAQEVLLGAPCPVLAVPTSLADG